MILSWLRRVAAACYDFVVGDDWRLALGVILALAVTAAAAAFGLPAWPAAPVIVLAVLVWSTLRAVRPASGSR